MSTSTSTATVRALKPRMALPEAAGSTLLRVFFGEAPLGVATAEYRSRLALWEQWQPVAVAAQG